MTTPTPTHHVHIDPAFGFSRLSDHNPERDEFARLAAAGRHDLVRARLAQSVKVCRKVIEYREVLLLERSYREQAI